MACTTPLESTFRHTSFASVYVVCTQVPLCRLYWQLSDDITPVSNVQGFLEIFFSEFSLTFRQRLITDETSHLSPVMPAVVCTT